MYAKDGEAVRLDVNDEARRGALRTECVSGVVGGEWSSLRTAGRGLCSRRGAAEPQRLTKTRWISRFS